MKFYIETLGCKVNTYESNIMAGLLQEKGYIEDKENPDVVIVNTCSVTNTADKKSLKIVHQIRKNHPNAILAVVGCMSQHTKDVPGDIVLGNQFKSKIVDYIEEFKKTKKQIIDVREMNKLAFENMELKDFHHTRAFVKIEDGCNNFCSYCIIPYTRGNVRSKKLEDVLLEISNLVRLGKKEIVLTGIHTGNYGRECGLSLAKLLHELQDLEELKRIRISSIEITELDEEFMEELKNNKKIVDHMHIPLQSGSNRILKEMNRKYDKEYFLRKLDEIREIRKDISITTDVIVGFPGETEEDFKECMETIQKCQFSKIHVFPYSKRENTKAALMPNQVEESIKKQRVKTLLAYSEECEKDYAKKFLNQTKEILVEQTKDGYQMGHTDNYLQVKYKGSEEDLHQFVSVQLKEIQYPFLIGEKLTEKVEFDKM